MVTVPCLARQAEELPALEDRAVIALMLFVREAAAGVLGHGHVDSRLDRCFDTRFGTFDFGREQRRARRCSLGLRGSGDGGQRERGTREQQGKRAGHGRASTILADRSARGAPFQASSSIFGAGVAAKALEAIRVSGAPTE